MKVREPQIIHPDPKYAPISLIEPTTLGYILIGAEVQPRPAPFVPNGRKKTELLARLTTIARRFEQLDTVEKVTIYDAIAFAPPSTYVRERIDAIRMPRFDLVVLIEAHSPAAARDVQTTSAYEALMRALTDNAKQLYVVAARNAKRAGDVDKTRPGVFLFNYFVGDDPDVVLELWDYLAGWYAAETGLDNSTLLVPLEGERSEYVAINHVRFDGSLLGIFLRQLSRSSFRTYLLANLEANHVGAMPVLYQLADLPRRSAGLVVAGIVAAGAVTVGAGLALRRLSRT